MFTLRQICHWIINQQKHEINYTEGNSYKSLPEELNRQTS